MTLRRAAQVTVEVHRSATVPGATRTERVYARNGCSTGSVNACLADPNCMIIHDRLAPETHYFAADSAPWRGRGCSGGGRRVEDGGHQFGVEVLGELAQFASGKPADVAVLVVVALSPSGHGASLALHHDPLALGDEAVRGIAVAISELGEQRLSNCSRTAFLPS